MTTRYKLDHLALASLATLLVLHAWALYAHHALGLAYGHKAVFLFHFDFERNLPTLFSTLLLIQAAALCASIARHVRVDRPAWVLLSLIFSGLAVDESFALHERLSAPVGALLPPAHALTFAWIVPYALLVLALAVVLFGWLRRLPPITRRQLLTAAVLYCTGALVLEALGGWTLAGDLANRGLAYDLIITAEETLEMTGLIWFAASVRRFRSNIRSPTKQCA